MLEFHIPEPAITLASTPPSVELDIDEPPEFNLTINQLNETNYKIFAQRYRATDMEEPPDRHVEVGYAWQSTPDEGTDEDKAEDTIAEKNCHSRRVFRVSCQHHYLCPSCQGPIF